MFKCNFLVKKNKALLVEDDIITQSLVQHYLLKKSCDVLLANPKEEAIKRLMLKLKDLLLPVYIWQQQVLFRYKNYWDHFWV